jgi:hypothetical protein
VATAALGRRDIRKNLTAEGGRHHTEAQRISRRACATIPMSMPRFAIVVFLLLLPISAHAWTRASDERIAKKAAALAPPDLRMMLERFESDYKLGLEQAQADEGSAGHQYFVLSREGRLRERIERETRGAIEAMRRGEPMSMFVQRLGVVAHLISDANDPFHVSNDAQLSTSHNDFDQYFERRLAKFPTVFYGLDPAFQLGRYLDRTFARSLKFSPLLREEYFRSGVRHTSADFDDRSTAFGIASVSYSRAVTDLVNVYYYIWKEAGGDVRSAALMREGNLQLHGH